jgi:hypothetical protein
MSLFHANVGYPVVRLLVGELVGGVVHVWAEIPPGGHSLVLIPVNSAQNSFLF